MASLPSPLTETTALMSMLRSALRVRVLLADHVTASLTRMSPLPPAVPWVAVSMVKLPLFCNAADTAAPVMLPPLAAMVKSLGSISQVPLWPLAALVVMRALLATVTWAAEVSMKPPLPPAGALASRVPPTCVSPCSMSAINRMRPSRAAMERAWIVPVLATTLADRASAALPVMIAWPPSATISCLFSMRVLTVAGSTATWSRPLAPASRVIRSPAAITTLPSRAVTMPSLLTVGASRATRPPSAAVISPWLTMPPLAPLREKTALPARKSASVIDRVEATSPPTSTWLPLPNSTPFRLISHTWPLAESLPWIWLASPAMTRLRATALVEGWMNWTAALLPMLKLCQLMMALSEPWVTVIWLPLWATPAWPATTWAPVGRALAAKVPAAWAKAGSKMAAPSSSAAGLRAWPLLLPRPRADSGAGTRRWVWSFQTRQ